MRSRLLTLLGFVLATTPHVAAHPGHAVEPVVPATHPLHYVLEPTHGFLAFAIVASVLVCVFYVVKSKKPLRRFPIPGLANRS